MEFSPATGVSLRTLKAAVDGAQTARDFLTDVDLSAQIETAARKTGETVAEGRADIEPNAVRDRLAIALDDDELAAAVEELIERGEPVAAESALLAEELERLAGEGAFTDAPDLPSVDWSAVAETFLETFEREVAAMDSDQRWFLLQAYNQRVLDAVRPDELDDARQSLTDEQGFDWVTDDDFEVEIEHPGRAWRKPFQWKHLANDYAVDRYHGDSERTFTQQVRETLDGGGHQLLVGPPGSGKTVACRQAAAAWHHDSDTGPVLHWSGGLSGKRLDPDALKGAVETVTELGDTLVVIEDAVRDPTLPIFEFLNDDEVANATDVSVLLDAREHELDSLERRVADAGTGGEGQSVRANLGTLVERDRVPYLSVTEVAAILDRFAETTDTDRDVLPTAEAVFDHLTTVESREREAASDESDGESGTAAATDAGAQPTSTRITPEQIQQTVGRGSAVSVASPMLLLSYYLPVAEDAEAVDTASSRSPLEQRVWSVFAELNATGDDEEGSAESESGTTPLRRKVVLTIATLAAADLPIHEEYLYALAAETGEYEAVGDAISHYRGRVHFGQWGETTGEGKHVLRSPHELWGITYLYIHEEEADSPTVLFEDCVNAVSNVIDDESLRRELARRAKGDFRGGTLLFDLLDDNPTQVADTVVWSLFQIGRDRPALVDLFGSTEKSFIEIPECCSDERFVQASLWRGEMFRTVRETDWGVGEADTDERRDARGGDDGLHQSVVELLRARQTAVERDIETDWVDELFYRELGQYALGQGDLRAAERLFNLSLTRSRRRENDHGVAASLQALGEIAQRRGKLDKAGGYLEECSEKLEKTGDMSDLAAVLGSLGKFAQNLGAFEAAEQYHGRSLSIFEEIGNRSDEATSLHSLGLVAGKRGNLDTAEQYLQQSLSINREIGDRSGEAHSLHGLGNIALKRGDFNDAERYYEQSLSINRKIGDRSNEAKNLHSLGELALEKGEFGSAEQHLQQSLSVSQKIGDRSSEARSLHSLGEVARNRGDFDGAERYYEQSLSIFEEIGDRPGAATSLGSLGNIALTEEELDTAEHYLYRSCSIEKEIGDRSGEANSLGSLGNIARNRGEFETAKKRYQSALEIFAELGQVREVIQTIQNLVGTAEGLDDEAAAREWAERGLAQLDDFDLAGLDEERHWFLTRHARLSGDPAELENRYTTALTPLLEDDLQTAVDRLEDVWDCRESFASDTDAYEVCLRAGVGYAAPATQRDTDAAADVVESVSEEVAPHRDRLTEPAAALFDLLVDGETDHDPDSLGEPADRADPDLDDVERVAYAGLLERLVSGPNPLDLYESVIRDIVTDEAELETVVRSCFAAWDHHTDTEGDQRRAGIAAGVILEAHRDLVEATLPGEREAVFETVREERDVLTEPIEALFEFLDTGATDHDPDTLLEAADTEEPTLVDIERIVVARLLQTLQSQ